jgi:hypothetical protein
VCQLMLAVFASALNFFNWRVLGYHGRRQLQLAAVQRSMQTAVSTGPCRNMLAAEQRRLQGQYEARLAELEAERHGAEADLAQVPP